MPKIVARSRRAQPRPEGLVSALRAQLLPAARTVLELADRLRRGFVGGGASAEVTAIAGRVQGAARTLERMVLAAAQAHAANAQDERATRSRLRHDLRSPLTAIRGFSDILIDEATTRGLGSVAFTARHIRAAADSALALVSDILKDDPALRLPTPEPARTIAEATVLVVDDDDLSRELLLRLVRQGGHVGVGVAGGDAALQVLRNRAFDVVLLDLEMPGLDGRHILDHILTDPVLRDTDVVMVSCVDRDEEIVACIDQGAIDYLVKPVRAELLRARIASALLRRGWRANDRDNYSRLEFAKAQTDSLLSNILPQQVISRVMAGEHVVADAFESVTILFSDFVGFTNFAARLEPREVVASLDRVFSAFDQLGLRHGVEKIKTIGDAYMAVAGLPTPSADHAETVAKLALDMQATLAEINPTLPSPLQMRIGIATGPVVAGVIGTHKIAFDVWGHAVNMAARHESYCEAGQIHVAFETAALLRGKFALQSRGILNIRGRGEVETFYLAR